MRRVVRDARVLDFLIPRIGGEPGKCTVVGLEEDGEIIAGAAYERCNGRNVFFHGASDGSGKWATRGFIYALMAHPFLTLNVPRMTTIVSSSRGHVLEFDAGLGFVEEGRLKGAAEDGSDSIYLVIWRDKCRWLQEGTMGSSLAQLSLFDHGLDS